jgi:hypothetical protein
MQSLESPFTGETPAMQFILDGMLYDTATATKVAISRGIVTTEDNPYHLPLGAESKRYEDVLYRTEFGNFFIHSHETVKFSRGKPVVQDTSRTVTPSEAVDWIQREGAMLLKADGLPLPNRA